MGLLPRPRTIFLSLLLAAGLGCVPTQPEAPKEGPWPLDRVLILTPPEEPPLEFQNPVVGTLRGLGVGFGRGIGVTALVAFSGAAGGPYGLVASAFVAAVFGVVYIPASLVQGAATAESVDRVSKAEAGILTAMAELRPNRRLGERLQRAFRELAGRDLPLAEGPLDSAGTADWVLEARILGIWNGATLDALSVDRPCELFVAAGLRLIRVSDGRTVTGRVALFQIPVARYTFWQWGEENGRRLKEGVVEACSVLAETFVEELYLATPHLRTPS